jgi:hypothetical protein
MKVGKMLVIILIWTLLPHPLNLPRVSYPNLQSNRDPAVGLG